LDVTNRAGIIEETVSGFCYMDRSWMSSFWEVFTECVIQLDADFVVVNLRRKEEGQFASVSIVGAPFADFVDEKDKAYAVSNLEALKNGDAGYVRFHCLCVTGRYFRWTLSAYFDGGVFYGCRGVAVDVTTQTLNETTLNWQRAVIEDGGDFVGIADLDGNSLYANAGAYNMAGYDPAVGELPFEKLFSPVYLEIIKNEGRRIAAEGGAWSARGTLVKKDGSLLPIEHNMFCVRNDRDETILIATVIRDISVFLEHERTLEEARRAAEIANAAKSEFLSRMSHEIRTPMNAIIGMINIGLRADDIKRKDYCFQKADNAARHLLNLINNILDMSKIEADKLEFAFCVFNFKRTIENITDITNVRAEEKQLSFTVTLESGIPRSLVGDELRLSQVITNLLANAIKFTPEKGTVALDVKKIGEDDESVKLKIEITDDGIGISKEQKERLFTSFNQADPGISQKYGGTGLGLAISKRIIESMGGEIWIESELGKGSKFVFTIWFAKTDGQEEPDEADFGIKTSGESLDADTDKAESLEGIFKGHTILIAEDIEINREIMSAILEETGVEIDYAEDGGRAIALFCENPGRYGLVFMDINMPEMDGYDATKVIRAREAGIARVPIVAMTANVFKEDVERCIASGMDAHIGKPVDARALIGQLKKYLLK